MIESASDFALVDVGDYEDFLPEEFESYPGRADAADGMPYDSLSDLDGLLAPPLMCLDPAWLTEIVREVEWFRANGFGGMYREGSTWYDPDPGPAPVVATPVAGSRQPPVVLKAFLDEASSTIRTWATAWEADTCPIRVVVRDGAMPSDWTSLGAISMSWSTSNQANFTDGGLGLPDGASDYELPYGELDPVTAYRQKLAEMAVRDFLSVRLFDREMPDDDPDGPEYGWQDVDDEFEDGDDAPGVSRRLLSRQLLAAHSDCELASTLFVPLSADPAPLADVYVRDRTMGQTETNGRYKSHDVCSDGCGTIHVRDGDISSIGEIDDAPTDVSVPEAAPCPPLTKVPASLGPVGPFPTGYTRTDTEKYEDHNVNSCHHGGDPCPVYTHAIEEFWHTRTHSVHDVSYDNLPESMEWPCELPEWIEVEDASVVLVAASHQAEVELLKERLMTYPGQEGDVRYVLEDYFKSTGTFSSGVFFAAAPAVYGDGKLTIPTIPPIPNPSHPVTVDPGIDPEAEPERPSGELKGWGTTVRKEHAAGIVAVLGAVVKVKFRASVKEE